MFRHPTFIARDVRGNPERKAFLAQQRIAAIAGAIRPDFAGLGKVNDVLLRVAWPGNIFLAGSQRSAHAMDAGHHALLVFIDFFENIDPDASHDSHIHDYVRRIGELHTDLRHRTAHWPHAEGQHVHGSSLHAAVEFLLQLAAHGVGIFPIVGGPGIVLRQRTDKRPVFHPGHVRRRRSGPENSQATSPHSAW